MADALKGKKVLVVDDEPDVCSMIEESLDTCKVESAGSYQAGRKKLLEGSYDVAILDIMGVQGHDLLLEFSRKLPCIMLTAHALTPEDLKKSIVGKATLYLPKQEMARIEEYVREVLHAKEPLWGWLFKKVQFSRFFGKGWYEADDFLKSFVLTEEEVEQDLKAGWGPLS